MRQRFGHLAQRFFNRPLAIRPEKAELIMAVLADRMGVTALYTDGRAVGLAPAAFLDDWDDDESGYQPDAGYDIVEGVACLEISGTLVQKLGGLRPYSGMTGYNGIRASMANALADPAVRAIALCIDSPGGEVAGCFDLVDAIYSARGDKPIWAILDEDAFSAAYAIASAADKIIVPRTGGVGSIGVIAMHVDWSRALAAGGLKVTLITYGERKADGAPEFPLSDEAKAAFQADIDAAGELFVQTVARNRGLPANSIRATQAATFRSDQGVQAGLADAVMAPDAAFRALLAELG